MQGKKTYQEKLFTNFQLSDRVPKDEFYRQLKASMGGSEETKMQGVADKDYHLSSDPDKGHFLKDFSNQEINNIPQSKQNPKDEPKK